MRFQYARRIYDGLPLPVKRAVCSLPFSWIAGHAYRRTLREAARFDQLPLEQVRAFQERKLAEVLRFATDQVPAYRPYRGAVERFRPQEALREFPLLVKDDLQSRFEQFLPRDIDSIPHYAISTGGTSGNQLKFFVDNESQAVETAFMHRQWQRVGYTTHRRKATFRGVTFPQLASGVYWQHNPIYNELQFSPFHMNAETLGRYVEELIKYQPEFLHGYPSAIDLLAKYVIREKLHNELPTLRAVLLGSEGPLPGQMDRIEQAFRTRTYSWYGHSERLVLAGECEKSKAYHQFPNYGYLELVSEDGAACDAEGQRGEIVGTGFLNRSMPLIRYRTADFATRLEPTCECGRNWDRFTQVEGRWKQDMLIGKHGSQISTSALNMHGSMFDHVIRYQYRQEARGRCLIRIMAGPAFSEADREAIRRAYQEKVGDELEIATELVEEIPLTARGKVKLLVSTLYGDH
jgi:phenylacetate-CoA ligase